MENREERWRRGWGRWRGEMRIHILCNVDMFVFAGFQMEEAT